MTYTWEAYKEWVANTVKGGAEFYCRGQLDPQWQLQTSFHRYSNNLTDYFNRVIPEVAYYVSAHEDKIINTFDPAQLAILLSKLQHHGFPTPLLDWTLSPYVAAYFAYKDINPRSPHRHFVSIYVFNHQLWSYYHPQPLSLNPPELYLSEFRPHANGNSRMLRQMAVTTVTNVINVEEYIRSEETRLSQQFLWKLDLPVTDRKIVMNELNLMGINSMTMFPDFDGMCSSMKEKHFNNIDIVPLIPPPPPPQIHY